MQRSRRDPNALADELPGAIVELARQLRDAGGRALVVGGWVRDRLLGIPTKDLDLEVYGLGLDRLERVLASHGPVIAVGRQFGVLKVKGLEADFSVPRRDSRAGTGHRGFRAVADPSMTPEQAVRRRDLTINALLFDPLSGELLDPAAGLQDLDRGLLRAVDARTFSEDPLRPVRVAQIVARLEFRIDPELLALCRRGALEELPPERLWGEWTKLLLRGSRPSLGLAFLQQADLLRYTPELLSLVGVPQDPEWHPEGDVWEHTLQAVDRAAALRVGDAAEDLALMFGALCHDLGKASTTEMLDGRWRSHEHEVGGEEPTRRLLARIGAPHDLVKRVVALVRCHLRPTQLVLQGSGPRAYRRLAREVEDAGVSLRLLERVARADALARDAGEGAPGFSQGERFLQIAEGLRIQDRAPADVVLGRHLIARGYAPGPFFREILERCREIQYEKGWDDPDRILDAALDE